MINMMVGDGWTKIPVLAFGLNQWLREDISLTLKLKSQYYDFSVLPMAESMTLSQLDEYTHLNINRTDKAFVRNVLLKGDGQAVVFAHSVMPLPLLKSRWARLTQLGKRPLGEVLFSDPTIKRSAFVFKKLNQNHALYRLAMSAYLSQKSVNMPKYLWARRSVFSLNQHSKSALSMMVTEVFLPEILYKEKVNVE